MKVQSSNLLHLLIFNILKIYVINVDIIWFTAQYHLFAAHGLGTAGLINNEHFDVLKEIHAVIY
jgi:hypothetical protein